MKMKIMAAIVALFSQSAMAQHPADVRIKEGGNITSPVFVTSTITLPVGGLGSFTVTPGTGSFNQGSYTVTPGSGSFNQGSYTVTPGSGSWNGQILNSITVTPGTGTFNQGSYSVTPGTGSFNQGSYTVTPGTGNWTTSQNGPYTVTPGTGTWAKQSNYRSDTFTGTGNGVTLNVSTNPLQSFSIVVKGTGASATTWDIRLEGSLDGTNFTQILQHTNATGDGVVLYSGSTLSPSLYFRSRVSGLVLGGASNVVVTILGVQ